MSNATTLQAPGLWISPSGLSAPEGALAVADNCVIRSKDVIEPRRGQSVLSNPPANAYASAGIPTPTPITGGVLVNWTSGEFPTPTTSRIYGALSNTGEVNDLGSFFAPWKRGRIQFANMLGRTYFTSSVGPQCVPRNDVPPILADMQPRRAGQSPPGISWGPTYAITATGGFLPANNACAYRATFYSKDSSGREIQSAPSSRVVITNPAASTAAVGGLVRTGGNLVTVTTNTAHGYKTGDKVTITPGEANFVTGVKTIASITGATGFTYTEAGANAASALVQTIQIGAASVVPYVAFSNVTGLTTSHFIRVWRTELSGSVSTVPGEDYYLVYERALTGGDIAAGQLTFTDNTPDALLATLAYFSASSDTILASKDLPPLATCIAVVGEQGDRMAYANCTGRHTLTVQLLATGGSAGLTTGDTITVTQGANSIALTMDGAPFGPYVFKGGSISSDIEKTALGIVDRFNDNALFYGVMARAIYSSGSDDSPGLITFLATSDSATGFTVTSSRPVPWNPQLPVASSQVTNANRLYLSQSNEPDAVPPLQFVDVGDPGEAILGVRAMRDTTVVVKEHSVWLLSGAWPNLRQVRLDATLATIAPDTLAVVGNQAYVLTTQGVVAISNGGVSLVSSPIEQALWPTMASIADAFDGVNAFSRMGALAWGATYESEHCYLLALCASTTDTAPQNLYAYNIQTRTWVRWPMVRTFGAVDPILNALVMGDEQGRLRRERKNYDRTDFRDDSAAITALGSISTTVTFSRTDAALVSVGDCLTQNGNAAWVTAVDYSTGAVTVDNAALVSGSMTWSKAFESVIEWVPEWAGDAHHAKQAQELGLHFGAFAGTGEVYSASELAPSLNLTHSFSSLGFGAAKFGQTPFGEPSGPRNERALTGPAGARGSYLTLRFRSARAFNSWRLQGRTIELQASGEKGRR